MRVEGCHDQGVAWRVEPHSGQWLHCTRQWQGALGVAS